MLETVMIYMGKEETVKKGTRLHGLLNTVLSEHLKPNEKKSILKQEYDIMTSVELEGSMVKMCNLSEVIAERATERGLKKGIEQGMAQGMVQGIEQGKLEISISLVKKGYLSLEEAAGELGMDVKKFKDLFDAAISGKRNQ